MSTTADNNNYAIYHFNGTYFDVLAETVKIDAAARICRMPIKKIQRLAKSHKMDPKTGIRIMRHCY